MRLTRRQLNRATLARQCLLRRHDLDVVDAVERIAGLQAQEPASPYLALWARIADFEADRLSLALHAHDLVKATLGRSTLHIVSRDDYRASIAALQAVTRTKWMSETRGLPVRRTLPALTEESLAFADRPRTNVELRDHAGTLGEPVPADELWRRIRRHGPFIHVPGDQPWAFGRRPLQIAAQAWVEPSTTDQEGSLEHIVRMHLRAFGPSRLADVAQWSGLGVTRLRTGLARIEEIVRHEDEDGRELFDLIGAPLPHEDTPAPPRLLPMWDDSLLAYADRSRVLPEHFRKRVIVKGGDVLPTFTLDGFVAGLWWAEPGHDEQAHIVLEPFDPLGLDERNALEVEAQGLAGFIARREPSVYSRYRHSRRRD